jgi:hypothetical protein
MLQVKNTFSGVKNRIPLYIPARKGFLNHLDLIYVLMLQVKSPESIRDSSVNIMAASAIMEQLQLQTHPEGGIYKERYRIRFLGSCRMWTNRNFRSCR